MRHHLDPERTKVSTNLGSSGPSPTRSDDADPSYAPPRVLGFVNLVDPKLQRQVADLRAQLGPGPHLPPWPAAEPLLWQDEGDQA